MLHSHRFHFEPLIPPSGGDGGGDNVQQPHGVEPPPHPDDSQPDDVQMIKNNSEDGSSGPPTHGSGPMDRQVTQQYLEDAGFGTPIPLPSYIHTIHEEFLFRIQEAGAVIESDERLLDSITTEDTLIVVDLQNDFLPPNGSFAVAEGDEIVEPICALIQRFVDAGAYVYCSRDYHPVDHCSFTENRGIFPSHCIQGTLGSHFAAPMAAVIQSHCTPGTGPVFVVYKGFSPDVDSFGAVPYSPTLSPRVARRMQGPHCSSTWTGSFLLTSSNIRQDCNAPPDVMSVLSKTCMPDHLGLTVRERRRGIGRLFVVGLALDYCVMDTAVNAAELPNARELFTSVSILLDYSRASHIPHVGAFSGFTTNPLEFAAQVRGKVRLVRTSKN